MSNSDDGNNMPEQNQKTTYLLIDDDLYVDPPGLKGGFKFPNPQELKGAENLRSAAGMPPTGNMPVFSYGRMFRIPKLREYRPEEEGLIRLGLDMEEEASPGENPDLPAGYVYLGQFIDHDLSFNTMTNRLPLGRGSLQDEKTFRSPSLDLDSLYGLDPATFKQTELGKKVYEDEVRLRVGETRIDADLPGAPALPNDLPRKGDPKKPEAAAVVDPRNDENLAVAQTHLAFIKFHNAVVQTLPNTLSGKDLFEAARDIVVRHYQWIILYDYLPKVIEEEVLDDVIKNGCKYLLFGKKEASAVPYEFAMAAFRFGHSLVNRAYEWNRYFQSGPSGSFPASLDNLFMFTGFGQNKLFNKKRLLSTWVIDWTRFFDFKDIPGVTSSERSNRARRIVPSLVSQLVKLPAFINGEDKLLSALPVRNLLRGGFLGLPAGQDIAGHLGAPKLKPNEIKKGANSRRRDILEKYGFDQLTPLWYYILKEAEEFHEGKRLGPVGSRIVAETFVGLIKKSKISILPAEESGGPSWKPTLGHKGDFSMPHMLFFVQRTLGNIINPLGN